MFPSSEEDLLELLPRLGAAAPDCARGTATYCERLRSYPDRYVANLMRGAPGYDLFFGEDEAGEDLTERNGAGGERFVCPSVGRVIYPQGAKNSRDEWMLIVNQAGEGYVQGIRIEECARSEYLVC